MRSLAVSGFSVLCLPYSFPAINGGAGKRAWDRGSNELSPPGQKEERILEIKYDKGARNDCKYIYFLVQILL